MMVVVRFMVAEGVRVRVRVRLRVREEKTVWFPFSNARGIMGMEGE